MIVHPDFLNHYKTRKLVQITGESSAPLALLRLWGHCQTSRKWDFPELRKADLASICEWNFPKISCEKALIACGWISKISGGGYHVRNWEEHNKSLINNWNRNPSGLAKEAKNTEPHGEPTGEPAANPIRPDQTRPDQISLDQTSPDQTDAHGKSTPHSSHQVSTKAEVTTDGLDSAFSISEGKGLDSGLGGLVKGLAASKTARLFREPSLAEVRQYLSLQFKGAEKYAQPFLDSNKKSGWHDNDGHPIRDWQARAKAYANAAERNQKLGK